MESRGGTGYGLKNEALATLRSSGDCTLRLKTTNRESGQERTDDELGGGVIGHDLGDEEEGSGGEGGELHRGWKCVLWKGCVEMRDGKEEIKKRDAVLKKGCLRDRETCESNRVNVANRSMPTPSLVSHHWTHVRVSIVVRD